MVSRRLVVTILILSILSGAMNLRELIPENSPGVSSSYRLGAFTGGTLAKVTIPLVVALIPAGIYRIFRKKMMPGLIPAVWALWIVLSLLPFLRG